MSSRFAGATALHMAKRGMAAQAATKAIAGPEVRVSTLESGLTVVSADSPTGVCTLSVVGRMGPKNENYDNSGISQAIRVASGLSNGANTVFGMGKNIAQMGSALNCTGCKEHTTYSINVLPGFVQDAADYILDGVSSQLFYPWELEDNVYDRMRILNETMPPCTKAVEMLLKAAYRNGLGNYNHAGCHTIGSHHTMQMREFFSQNFTAGRSALVGLGIDHELLTRFGGRLELSRGAGNDTKSKYYGGELRCESGGNRAMVMIGGEVGPNEAVAAKVLASALGSEPAVSYSGSTSGGSKIKQAAGNTGCVRGFSLNFTDSCFVGVCLSTTGAAAGKTVEAAGAALRSGALNEAQLAGAKKSLIFETLGQATNNDALAEALGKNAIGFQGELTASADCVAKINAVSLGDVQALAKKLASSKLSMSTVGNLSTVPYLDTL